MMRGVTKLYIVMVLVVVMVMVTSVVGVNVTYDHRALVIDGKRQVLVSGFIPSPRSTPDMWPGLIQKAKDGGLDVIETYVFWNLHEPVRNQYDFEGRKDLVTFLNLVAEAGLYAHIRIGPYVCVEWNYGGFPLWLHFIPGVVLQTDNEPFKAEMKRFTANVVSLLKDFNLYASQGGPIILSQIENEYGNIEKEYGPAAQNYIKWAASMATSLNTVLYRPVEDLAFAVARFYQRGGTFQNYYMYHGGSNFGWTTGGPFIAASYDFDVPLDEYGVPRQPKWGHLKDLHKAIKLCEEALVATDPKTTSLANNVEAVVYKTSSTCAAFLANIDTQHDATVSYNGKSYHLPAWSVSILPDCKHVVYNTAKINSMATIQSFVSASVGDEFSDSKAISSNWSYIREPIGISTNDAFDRRGLLEQINTTADKVIIYGDEPFLNNASQTTIHVKSLGHAFHLIVNDQLEGSAFGIARVCLATRSSSSERSDSRSSKQEQLVSRRSSSLFQKSVIGLRGESLGLETGGSSIWVAGWPKGQPLTWYKTNFEAPSGDGPLVIDFKGITKGGDRKLISFRTQELESLCSHVSQNLPLPIEAWSQDKNSKSESEPRVSLECPHPNQVISSIKFASFGTPQGKCGSYSHGECRSTNALSILQKVKSFVFNHFVYV
nr:beta-galactosidase 8 [Tanacetum cinerariifolium]